MTDLMGCAEKPGRAGPGGPGDPGDGVGPESAREPIQAGPGREARDVVEPVQDRFDVAVVGAGFGGLGAALRLAERGARVALLEALNYPGGCASTFQRGGARYEAGATLFSGLGEGDLFRRWVDTYGLDVTVDWPDPVVELRTGQLTLPIERERGALVRRLGALPGAPVAGLERFFDHQRAVADVLWELLADPRMLPPFGLRELGRHALRAPRYAPLLLDVGRPLASVLGRYGLERFEPLRQLLDALCQITVQCGIDEAEAPFALGTMDYYWRGTGHVRGGIGRLAHGLVDGFVGLGGEMRYSHRVRRIERVPDGWRLHTSRGVTEAGQVICNLLPHDLDRVLDPAVERPARLERLKRAVESGWGACMLYLQLEPTGSGPAHVELVDDPSRPFLEGNHVFCSISGADDGERAPDGRVTATVSTHVPMDKLRGLDEGERGAYVAAVQDAMHDTLRRRAPEVAARIATSMSASPRTFERFTGRTLGYVGGVPRRAGLRQYLALGNPELAPGLYLVGDSVFPGQSTLATALGGWKLAERCAAGR